MGPFFDRTTQGLLKNEEEKEGRVADSFLVRRTRDHQSSSSTQNEVAWLSSMLEGTFP